MLIYNKYKYVCYLSNLNFYLFRLYNSKLVEMNPNLYKSNQNTPTSESSVSRKLCNSNFFTSPLMFDL